MDNFKNTLTFIKDISVKFCVLVARVSRNDIFFFLLQSSRWGASPLTRGRAVSPPPATQERPGCSVCPQSPSLGAWSRPHGEANLPRRGHCPRKAQGSAGCWAPPISSQGPTGMCRVQDSSPGSPQSAGYVTDSACGPGKKAEPGQDIIQRATQNWPPRHRDLAKSAVLLSATWVAEVGQGLPGPALEPGPSSGLATDAPCLHRARVTNSLSKPSTALEEFVLFPQIILGHV